MKNKKIQTKGVIHSITPFGRGAFEVSPDGLFDDCPICVQLRRDLETGEAIALDEEKGESDN